MIVFRCPIWDCGGNLVPFPKQPAVECDKCGEIFTPYEESFVGGVGWLRVESGELEERARARNFYERTGT